MDYYIRELRISEGIQKTAGVKAREDADFIFSKMGIKELPIENEIKERSKLNLFRKFISHLEIYASWKKSFKDKTAGDRIIIQFPCIEHSLFLVNVLRKAVNRDIEVILLIHDLELVRNSRRKDLSVFKRIRMQIEEKSVLRCASKVIVHNEKMKEYLINFGIRNSKIIVLGVFDYILSESYLRENRKYSDTLIVAGNLRPHKAKYVYHLPEEIRFNLYGVGYSDESKKNISYKGAFLPEELCKVMEGDFGLVWDGTSCESCKGVFGEYLKLNNPHKVSLYLACNIPVIIWKQAALAEFVKENKCGILVDSLYDLNNILENMSTEEYEELKEGAKNIGEKVREGAYLKKAIEGCLSRSEKE